MVDATRLISATNDPTFAASADTLGRPCFPGIYPHAFTYNGDGTLNTDAFTDGTFTWTQTFTWVAGNCTAFTGWVRSG